MRFKYLIFLLAIICCCSCSKDKIDLTWKEQVSPTNLNLSSVHFTDQQTGHIVGGQSWYTGVYLKTTNAGADWNLDTLTDKLLMGMHFDDAHRGYAVGIDGYLFYQDPGMSATAWHFHRLPVYDSHRDISFFNKDKGVVVSGGAYQKGKVFRLNADFEIIAQDSFSQELSAVCFSSENVVHAVGYGIVLRSTDGGMTWKVNGIDGDFFRDVHFPTRQVGYAVGHNGMIIKTNNEGQSWEKIRNGENAFGQVTAFRAVHFVNTEIGYAVGDRGAFMRTVNGGKDWASVNGFPNVDLYDVFVISSDGYLVGEDGRIFWFEN